MPKKLLKLFIYLFLKHRQWRGLYMGMERMYSLRESLWRFIRGRGGRISKGCVWKTESVFNRTRQFPTGYLFAYSALINLSFCRLTCVWWSFAVSPHSQGSRSSGGSGTLSGVDGRGSGDESTKRRRISSAKQAAESSSAGDETLSAFPCLVTLNPGVRVATVAAGGRHTLALSGRSSPGTVLCWLSIFMCSSLFKKIMVTKW